MSSSKETQTCGCSNNSCSRHTFDRREFVKLVGLGAAGAGSLGLPLMAGPFEQNEYLETIPIDKKLDPAWVRSLFARGEKQTYSDREVLTHIGMPVGGLFAGTVYLSGDGRLWLWDIFNRDQNGILPRDASLPEGIGVGGNNNMRGLNYLHPAPVTQPFKIGFALTVGEASFRSTPPAFAQVSFDGRYPIGRVTYRDADCPVEVQLGSLLAVHSAERRRFVAAGHRDELPREEHQRRAVDVEIPGELQNAVCLETKVQQTGQLRNRIVAGRASRPWSARPSPPGQGNAEQPRPDIVFDDFEATDVRGLDRRGHGLR